MVRSTPAPPVNPPPSPSPYKNRRQDELEALKQRGLAKLLNKHFTSVTKSIAEEKAAADAALRDLEQRKANTSAPHATDYSELSPYDKLYLELQQKKADCKRKEKETLLLYQRYVNKFGSTGAVTVPTMTPDCRRKAAPSDYSPRRPAPSKELVPQLATELDKTIEEQVERGADRLPSSHTMGVDDTYQKVQATLEDQERAFSRKLDAERGVDARYTPRGSKATLPRSHWQRLPGAPPKPPLDPNSMPSPPCLTETPISMASNGDIEGSNITLPTVDPTIDTKGAEEDSDGSNDNKSAVSGLTSVEVMSEAESRLIEYLKSETEAIRQMLEEEDVSTAQNSRASTSYSSQVASQTDLAAKQAEEMLFEMKKILADSQQSESDSVVSDQKRREPYQLDTNNPDEKWMVYWDPHHERNYYHEVNSNTVQWEKPRSNNSADRVPMSDYTKKSRSMRSSQQLTYEDVMPEIHAAGLGRTQSTRRLQYRRQQRRRRRRRRRIMVVTFVAAVGAGIYYKENLNQSINQTMSNVHPHLPKSMQWQNDKIQFLDALSDKVNDLLPESIQWESAMSRVEKETAAREQAAKKKEEEARKEAERKEQEKKDAERKAREMEEAKRKEEEEEEARKVTEAALETLEDPDQQALAIPDKSLRPWACNIPFAYLLHKKCWRAARETPIFDLKALIQAMMQ